MVVFQAEPGPQTTMSDSQSLYVRMFDENKDPIMSMALNSVPKHLFSPVVLTVLLLEVAFVQKQQVTRLGLPYYFYCTPRDKCSTNVVRRT